LGELEQQGEEQAANQNYMDETHSWMKRLRVVNGYLTFLDDENTGIYKNKIVRRRQSLKIIKI